MSLSDSTELYQAVIASFSLVSYADGQVHMSELSRLATILKSEGIFKDVSAGQLQKDISELVNVLSRDFEKTKTRALLSTIAKVKQDAKARELVLKIARLTLMADGEIAESEEKILADIHTALGVSGE